MVPSERGQCVHISEKNSSVATTNYCAWHNLWSCANKMLPFTTHTELQIIGTICCEQRQIQKSLHNAHTTVNTCILHCLLAATPFSRLIVHERVYYTQNYEQIWEYYMVGCTCWEYCILHCSNKDKNLSLSSLFYTFKHYSCTYTLETT